MVLLRLANQKYPVLLKFDKKISSGNPTLPSEKQSIPRQTPNKAGKEMIAI